MLSTIDPYLGMICAFLSSFTWALGVTTYSVLSEKYTPCRINMARALLSLPFFFVAVLLMSRGRPSQMLGFFQLVTMKQYAWLAVSVLGSFAFGDMLFMWATIPLGVPGALAISSIYPLWAALAGWLFRGEVLSLDKIVGLLAVVAGTIIVILSGGRKAPAAENKSVRKWREHYGLGVFLALACSVFWCVNAFAIAKVGPSVSPALAMTIRLSMALVLTPLLGFVFLGEKKITLSRPDFKMAWPVIFVEACLGSFLFLYGLIHSPLALGAALTSLAPVLAVPFVFFRHRERIPKLRLLGIFIVVAGLWGLVS